MRSFTIATVKILTIVLGTLTVWCFDDVTLTSMRTSCYNDKEPKRHLCLPEHTAFAMISQLVNVITN